MFDELDFEFDFKDYIFQFPENVSSYYEFLLDYSLLNETTAMIYEISNMFDYSNHRFLPDHSLLIDRNSLPLYL